MIRDSGFTARRDCDEHIHHGTIMKKATGINIALLLSSLFLVILLSEMILRFFYKAEKETAIWNTILGEEFPYSFLPNSSFIETNSEFSMVVKINNMGLRDYDYGPNYFKDSFVVLGTGDSFTWGVGVNMEEGYLAVAENILNAASLNIKIIKAGMPGYHPLTELDFVEHYVKRKLNLVFNMMTIGFLPNDIDELLLKNSIRYGQQKPSDLNIRARSKKLLQSSFLYQRIQQLKLFRTLRGKASFHYGRKMNEEEKQIISDIIRKAEGYSSTIPVVFVLIPQMDNILYKAYPDMFRVIKKMNTGRNMFFMDTYDELVKYDPYSLYYVKDQHLTKLGQNIVGRLLAKKIGELRFSH
jgi:hypothetical protein